MHLAVLYPYLLQLMDEYVFEPYRIDKDEIKNFPDTIYREGIRLHNDEAISYALFFALKHDFTLANEDTLDRGDCISMMLCYLYILKNNHVYRRSTEMKPLLAKAKTLISSDMYRNWLFCYEVQTQVNLPDEWQQMKKNGVSFIRSEYIAKRYY